MIPIGTTCPPVNEVVAIISGDGEEEVDKHQNIVLRYKQGGLCYISHLHPLYSPLYYIMLFPNGDQGYHQKIDIVQPEASNVQSKYVS